MGVRIHKVNEQPMEMGDVVVANHMGFLDVLVLLTFFPSVFIIKHEMRKVPFFGKCLEHQGHVFVKRGDSTSRRAAGQGLVHVLERGDRIIVFPEGQASPGAARLPFKPFSFVAASRLGKTVQGCVIDYLPDRDALKWDNRRAMLPQLIELAGRKHTDVSIEFFPPEGVTGDPAEMAERYKDTIQARLEEHDLQRAELPGGGSGAV
jgi:1-acyl-sn-glycerol-3-phosphate acyltransferase